MRLLLAVLTVLTMSTRAAAVPIAFGGSFYDVVAGPVGVGISWVNANAAAQTLVHNGLFGHLATVTSGAENLFITNNFGGVAKTDLYWLGGIQPGNVGPFTWVTGEAFGFTNWDLGSPVKPPVVWTLSWVYSGGLPGGR